MFKIVELTNCGGGGSWVLEHWVGSDYRQKQYSQCICDKPCDAIHGQQTKAPRNSCSYCTV